MQHGSSRIASSSRIFAPDACFPSNVSDAAPAQFEFASAGLYRSDTKKNPPGTVPSAKYLSLYREKLDHALDEIAKRAVWRAMRAETPAVNRSAKHNRTRKSARLEPATRYRALFHRRFSGRAFIAGGVSAGFVPTSIVYAYQQKSPLQLSDLASRKFRLRNYASRRLTQ